VSGTPPEPTLLPHPAGLAHRVGTEHNRRARARRRGPRPARRGLPRHHRRLRRECLPDRGVIPGLASPNSETA